MGQSWNRIVEGPAAENHIPGAPGSEREWETTLRLL